MDPEKQKTAKKHIILLAAGILAVLSVLSLTTSSNDPAPPQPSDAAHQQSRKVEECLKCHANADPDPSGLPMKHPPRANCGFCHAKK
jgi:hypothetical protein